MIAGYHVIFGAYGFWLPNDPRGSWSDFVGSWDLFRYGPATKTTARRSVAKRPHDPAMRLAAKQDLARPAVQFTGLQARAVGCGFAAYFEKATIPVWACAILPDHVHLVVGPPGMDVEQLVIQLKGAATETLKEQGIHPFGNMKDERGRTPKCFARGEWKAFLDAPDIPRAVRYVEENPEKEGKPRQRWSFVVPYIGFGYLAATRRVSGAERVGHAACVPLVCPVKHDKGDGHGTGTFSIDTFDAELAAFRASDAYAAGRSLEFEIAEPAAP